jgi:hypothetical protein
MVQDVDINRIIVHIHKESDGKQKTEEDTSHGMLMDVNQVAVDVVAAMQQLVMPDSCIHNARIMFELASKRVSFLVILAGTGCIGSSRCNFFPRAELTCIGFSFPVQESLTLQVMLVSVSIFQR